MQVDQREHTEVRRTVRRVKGYWRRAGVPRGVRRQRVEELRAHLLEAVADGRSVEDVVGADVAAFAAEWAEAERPRPLLDLGLQLVAAVTLVPGGAALLHPWFRSLTGVEDAPVGIPGETLALLAAIVPLLLGLSLLRLRRHHLTTQQAALAGVALFVGYGVLLGLTRTWWAGTEVLLVSPAAAWTMVALGTVSQVTASWSKRRPAV